MTERSFEHALRDWLEDGSDRTPEAAIDAVRLAIETTPQDRALRIPWRFNPMPSYLRLAAVAAVIAVVGVGAISYFGGRPSTGGPATPAPTPSAAPIASLSPTTAPTPTLEPLDPSDWVLFTSSRYGFTIKHPADWIEQPADHAWTFEKDIESWTSTATESFVHPDAGGGVKVSAWAVRVAPGTTAASWVQSFCDATNPTPCADLGSVSVEVESGDGHAGLFTQQTDAIATFLVGETIYVVAAWREETDTSVAMFGGTRRLMEAFISTLTLPAEPPEGLPSPS